VTAFELSGDEIFSSFHHRWNHYLVLLFGVVGFFIGINLRDSALYATTLYINPQAGIRVRYPENWLLDESGDYVFRVRNVAQPGFKTTIQLAAIPVNPNSSPRTVFDALTLNRAQVLASYNVLSELPFLLPNEVRATAMLYTFVYSDPNPFLQSIPVVVIGLDVLTIQRGQAIIITFLSASDDYDDNYRIFENFLSNLEF
jgi:hypothetical protein